MSYEPFTSARLRCNCYRGRPLWVLYARGGLRIHTGTTYRVAAANWAGRHPNRPYNLNFAVNKTVESSKYNCSRCVWASYKISGLDLDSDGGPRVYPDDIRNSRLLTRY